MSARTLGGEGRVAVHDVYRLPLDAWLVVLSAHKLAPVNPFNGSGPQVDAGLRRRNSRSG
jgi:hypothetical protein